MNMPAPQIVSNPIRPEVTKAIREAFNSKAWYIVVCRQDDDGVLHRFQNRSDSFDDNAMLESYRLYAAKILEVDIPNPIVNALSPKAVEVASECSEIRKSRQSQDNG